MESLTKANNNRTKRFLYRSINNLTFLHNMNTKYNEWDNFEKMKSEIESKKFKSKRQFYNKDRAAYNVCVKNGWLDILCADLPEYVRGEKPVSNKAPYISEIPELMCLWSKEKNPLGLASTIRANSLQVEANWICPKCGNVFPRIVSRVYHGSIYCRTCTSNKNAQDYIDRKIKEEGSFEDNYPILATCWDYEENEEHKINGRYLPSHFLSHSNKEVYWKCPQCNYRWKQPINTRVSAKFSCPECYRKDNSKLRFGNEPISVTHPYLLEIWDKDNTILPEDVTAHDSTHKIKWICPKGHKWKQIVSYMVNTTSDCPCCKKEAQTSFPEQAVLFYLMKVTRVIGQYKFDGIHGCIDIFLPDLNVAIEYDGYYYHKGKEVIEKKKDEFLVSKGVRVIRIKENNMCNIQNDSILIIKDKNNKYLPVAIAALTRLLQLPDIEVNLIADEIAIMEQYKTMIRENSIAAMYPHLLEEWDYEKNRTLDPYCFSQGSKISVWWKCKTNPKHIWKASILSRRKTGCPYCVGVRFFPGENDFATKRPDLLKEWDDENNKGISPDSIAFGDSQKVNWICSECGHKWQAPLSSRSVNNRGCPECAKKKRTVTRNKTLVANHGSLADNYPVLMLDWDWNKNKGVNPKSIPSRTRAEVYWKCHICQYEWQKSPDQRIGKHLGCPECSKKEQARTRRLKLVEEQGSIVTTHSHLLLDWNGSVNQIPSEELVAGSHERVNWKCHLCGHEWPTSVYKRAVLGHRCPKCKSTMPIAKSFELADR